MRSLNKIIKDLGYPDITSNVDFKVWNLVYRVLAKQDIADLNRAGIYGGERFDDLVDLLYDLDVDLKVREKLSLNNLSI